MTEHESPRAGLPARFWTYQRERFPLAGFVPLIATFTFSSAAYSRLLRGAPGYIPVDRFLTGLCTALVVFFLLRVLDEHKDEDVDRRYRPELPVPRGLMRLGELRWIGVVALLAVVLLNAVVLPVLLIPLALVAVWAALMTREFFVRDWLRNHPTAYLLSHMAIMPLIDLYTTGLDWLEVGSKAPSGLSLFLGISFLNGMILEVGRKIRWPGAEREGVDSYTSAWGLRAAPTVWLALLGVAAALSVVALLRIPSGAPGLVVVGLAGVWTASAGIRFLKHPSRSSQTAVDRMSQLWMLATYVALGPVPFLVRSLWP